MNLPADEIYNDLNSVEKSVLLLAGSRNQPVAGNTALQKQLFLMANMDDELAEEADFQPYSYGPFSEGGEESIKILESYGLIKRHSNNMIELTERGKCVYECAVLHESEDKIKAIDDFKEFMNDMTRDEMCLFVYANYPEFTEESLISDRIFGNRVQLSKSLYKKGKISLSMAAVLADLSIERFLDEYRRSKKC